MKRSILLVGVALFAGGCSSQFYSERPSQSAPSTVEILTLTLEEVVQVGGYSPDLTSGDRFLMTIPLGAAFDVESVTFAAAAGSALWGDNREIDKAYRFAKMVDMVFACDSVVRSANCTLDDIVDGILTIDTYTSPTYNAPFRLALTTAVADSVGWNYYYRHQTVADSVAAGRRTVRFETPLYTLSGNLACLPVIRTWLKYPVELKYPYRQTKWAVICAVIVARNLTIEILDGRTIVAVDRRTGQYSLSTAPPEEVLTTGDTIVGYVCMIL